MLINTPELFAQALPQLQSEATGGLMVDLETTGLSPYCGDLICGMAIGAIEHDRVDYYFSFRHKQGVNLPLEYMQPLREFMRGRTLRGHNEKFDCHFLLNEGFDMPPAIEDSIVAAHTANENETEFSLEHLGGLYLGAEAVKEKKEMHAALRKLKAGKEAIHLLPPEIVAPYAIGDIAVARQLYVNRLAEVDRWRLGDLLRERHEFLLEILRCEQRGILLDVDEVHRQIAYTHPRLADYEARLQTLQQQAGLDKPVNIRSPKQLREWLKLPKTDKQTLLDILEANPREDIQTLLDYREIKKAESTYFLPFLARMDSNQRLHTTFKLHGARTWRLSSSQPNLQNCSKDLSDRVYSVRKCFKARDGYFLLEVDYSSIEPRIAAHYSGDEVMCEAFRQQKDFYRTVASEVAKQDNITDEQRGKMKTTVLGVLYGMGSYKSAVKLGLRHAKLPDGSFEYHYEPVWAMSAASGQLEQFPCSAISAEFCSCAGKSKIALFYEGFPKIQRLIRIVREKAKRLGYFRNPITGAVRRLKTGRDHHKAPNSLIQQTAAEILRRAFVKISKALTEPNQPQIVLTVHDSILFEIRHDDAAWSYVQWIVRMMETTTPLSVPVKVDAKVGHNWANMGSVQVA